MNLRLAVCVGFASQLLTGAAMSQPALERVEQQLRKQTTGRTAAVEDAGAARDSAAGDDQNTGYLGVLGDDRQENGKGVRVTKTDTGGPAAKGGMKTGDLITSIDNQPVKSVDDMGEIMSSRHAGDMVKFGVERKGETRELQVRLERRPPPDPARLPFGKQADDLPAPGGPAPGAPGGPAGPGDSVILSTRRPKLGIRTVHLTPFIREQVRLPGSYVAGVYVTYVDADAPAGKAGLPNNSVITAVDGEPIDSPDTLAALVHRAGPGQVLNVVYYHRDHETQTAITLAGGLPQSPAPGPHATVRAKPIPAAQVVPAQPPGFAPDEAEATDSTAPADKITALERRIAELEKRIAELEAAATTPAAPRAAPADEK
jgi:membrane-associated protease RseP (regulator of RpoE activity)